MNKGEPIKIRKVANGFIVTFECDAHTAASDHNIMVFNDVSIMRVWMTEHFKDPEHE